jgi:phosphoribosyl 1,2-cyclic phosphate phosphodiesterase
MSGQLEFTILGCGSSGGVPRADGNWGVCDPAEPRNRRSRCSLAVRRLSQTGTGELTTAVVDLSPEFRLQAIEAGLTRLDTVLLSHDHADQTHGLDDIRAFAIRHRQRITCLTDETTRQSMLGRFRYVFEGDKGYPAISDLGLTPGFGQNFEISGPSGAIPVMTYDQDHGDIRALGFRFGGVAYSSDVVRLPSESMALLQDLDVLIVDALRYAPHPTHANLEQALAWVEELQPRRTILTNMHIDLDYQTLMRELPPTVEPAFDGMRFTAEI